MKTVTTLILALRILLSLGIGTATAQGLAPGSSDGAYLSGYHQAASQLLDLTPRPVDQVRN